MPDTHTPNHVGLILDGNRRWAKANGLPSLEGHKIGYNHLKDIARAIIFEHQVKYVSAYIFSIENWNRTPAEVKYLMDHALMFLTRDVAELNKEGVRVVWLGVKDGLSEKLQKAIERAEEVTKNNTEGTLGLCFNYTGQQEIVEAAKSLVQSGIDQKDITVEEFEKHLHAPAMPPIDALIRTSGEQRLSGFMLWRVSYAELFFVKKHWPEFSKDDLAEVLSEYAKRQRRFGA